MLRVAGPAPRAIAWLIDATLRLAGYLGALFALTLALGELGLAALILVVFVGEWFYPVAFEVLARGQTPGKRALGLRVVHDDGTPVDLRASVLRNLLLAADFLPFGYCFGLLTTLVDTSFRRLGDLAAGTLVVYAGGERSEAPPLAEVAPLAPPLALAVEEQRAVIAFAERLPLLSAARADELAGLATPLHDGDDPARRLLRIAAWLRGRRAEAERS